MLYFPSQMSWGTKECSLVTSRNGKNRGLFCPALSFHISEGDFEISFTNENRKRHESHIASVLTELSVYYTFEI